MEFIDTAEDNAWLSEDAYDKAVRDVKLAEQIGYVKVPEWFPLGIGGYKYQIFGQVFGVMKPKPKLRHVLRYKYEPEWWQTYKAKRFIKKVFSSFTAARRQAS